MQDGARTLGCDSTAAEKMIYTITGIACKCNKVDIRTQAHVHCAAACRPQPVQLYSTPRTWRKRVISPACMRLCLAWVTVSIFLARVVVLSSSMHPASAPLFLVQVPKPQLLCSSSNKASTTKEKSTWIYSRFTISWPRPSVDQVGLRRPVPRPFFTLLKCLVPEPSLWQKSPDMR